MYIGEFARLAGTTPKAVRLYEQLGLPEPRRRQSIASTGPGSGVGRLYPRGPAAWLQSSGAGSPVLAGVTSPRPLPWQKGEQLAADKLAQIEAGGRQAATPAPGLSQCATCWRSTLPLWRPWSGTPRRSGSSRNSGSGARWLDSVPYGTGVGGLTARSHAMTPNLFVLNGNPKPTACPLARERPRRRQARGARVTLHHVGGLAFEPDLHHG